MSCHPGDEPTFSHPACPGCGILQIHSKGEYLWPAWVSGATLLAAIVVWHLRFGLMDFFSATSPENVSRKSPPKKRDVFFLYRKIALKNTISPGDML